MKFIFIFNCLWFEIGNPKSQFFFFFDFNTSLFNYDFVVVSAPLFVAAAPHRHLTSVIFRSYLLLVVTFYFSTSNFTARSVILMALYTV